MWHSLNETFSSLCSSVFWNNDLTWNSPDPDFTLCFEKTILIWYPCAFLWICSPLEIYYLCQSHALVIPFNLYNVSKLITIAILGVTALTDAATCTFISDESNVVDILTPLIKFLTFILFFGLTYANLRCGIRSSGILFIFSFLLAFLGAPQLRTVLKSKETLLGFNDNIHLGTPQFFSYPIYYTFVLIVFFLNCFADACPDVKLQSTDKNRCPENDSPFISKIFFASFDKFMWNGYKKPLKNEDVWDLDCDMESAEIAKKFESEWFETDHDGICMGSEDTKKTKRISILRPLFKVFGSQFVFAFVFKLLHSSLNFASPMILNLILAFVGDENEFLWRGYLYVFLLLLVAIFQMLFWNYHFLITSRIGLQIRTALVSVVYKKVLKISNGARKNFTFGEIVNLISVDVQRFIQLMTYIPLCLLCPIEICACIYYLWNILGPSTLAGVAVLVTLLVVNCVMISKIQVLQMKQMDNKDRRVKLINEILSGIKVLKLYACEPNFEKRVARIRDREIRILKDAAYLHAGSSFTWTCTPFLVSFVTFGVYVLSNTENVFDAQVAFVSLTLFNVMKQSMKVGPMVVKGLVQANVAVERIDKFLNSEELDLNAVSHETLSDPIVIRNGKFSWDNYEGSSVLRNINVKVKKGNLVAVIGPVGSGKSSMLSAILGEMYKLSGFVNTTGKLAYVPQQAWIQNSTLKDNITFGRSSNDSSFYSEVLEACALSSDLETLPGGDQTEIGEKGINLSGGQKQRISLARAVYSKADVYLLDDPLSAVDIHVGQHIFEKVIGPDGLLKEKTRIFVTHNLAYLSRVDFIIFLRNGDIVASGTHAEMLKKNGYVPNFLVNPSAKMDEKTAFQGNSSNKRFYEQCFNRCQKVSTYEADKIDNRQEQVLEGALTVNEEALTGNVKWNVFAYYFGTVGPLMSLTILMNLLYQVFSVASNYWLSAWSNDGAASTSVPRHTDRTKQYSYLRVYALFGLGQALSVIIQTIALCIGLLKAAKYVHNRLLNSVLQWPLVTFYKIPTGRIINRFGFDVDVLDNVLPTNVLELLTRAAMVMSTLFVISCNTPMFVTVLLPLAAIYYFIQRVYAATSKQLKRLESASKSPIYSHFGDTISGAQSIRAYDLQTDFIKASEEKIDFNQKSSYAGIILNRWFGVRLGLLGAVIVFSAALFAVLGRNAISISLVGLSVTYALQVTGNLFSCVRMASEVETNIVAVERIKEYSEMTQEAPWMLTNSKEVVPRNWPNRGEIIFRDFYVRYQEYLEPALRGINFRVNAGEKVGVVGRTGAGKSTLALSLFRIIESAGGSIIIDDFDVSKIGLHTLRSRITIIPQDPVLFSGTLRKNLDPSENCSDENVWKALELANLKPFVSTFDAGLQHRIEEGGNNFSVGQRQLICLARALLRQTRILILDEATAAVDVETDDLIQATIRREFTDRTVLTIAHRLNTVLDCDRIMVLDHGRVAEFDSPGALLSSKESIFYSMAVDAALV